MDLVLSSIWTLARLKVQCQESSAAGSLGYQLTEMGRRMPSAPGGTNLTMDDKELLRKEGGWGPQGICFSPSSPACFHIPITDSESAFLFT